jgi:hypothetical protein
MKNIIYNSNGITFDKSFENNNDMLKICIKHKKNKDNIKNNKEIIFDMNKENIIYNADGIIFAQI